jgi:hypothetical protein
LPAGRIPASGTTAPGSCLRSDVQGAKGFLRCLSYSIQRALQILSALCPGPVLLTRVPFGRASFLHRLRRRRRGVSFVRQLHWYYRPVRLPVPVHREILPLGFLARPARAFARPVTGSPGSRARRFRAPMGSQTPPGPPVTRVVATVDVAFRVGGPRRHQVLSVFRSSIPSSHVPLPTLHRRSHDGLRMTGGRSGSLLLLRVALSSTPSRRFIPAHPPFLPSSAVPRTTHLLKLDQPHAVEGLI